MEAYGGEDDLASHARFGRTGRNAPMYGPPGRAYVYLVYGMHACLNVVIGPEGDPGAILIRAVEPIEGVDAIRVARSHAAATRGGPERTDARQRRLSATATARLAAGPGLVSEAFGVSREMNGWDLLDPSTGLHLEAPSREGRAGPVPAPGMICASARIGIGYAPEPWRSIAWRFHLREHPSVSRSTAGR